MKILITNDDGITSDGIIRLAECAKKFGEVWVVAPEDQRSAMSHSITLRHSFRCYEYDFPVEGVHAYSCTGTPGDCVRVGVLNIVPGKPDVVLSGINYGYNSATDLQYSATAGAAFEAAFQGILAIAVSEGTKYHETTDRYLEETLLEVIDKPLEFGQIWNINFPDCPLADCRGILRERTVGKDSMFHDHYDETKIDGGTEYMVHGVLNPEAEEDSDLRALFDNYVSIGVVNNIG